MVCGGLRGQTSASDLRGIRGQILASGLKGPLGDKHQLEALGGLKSLRGQTNS